MLGNLLPFILLIGPLILVHELGHLAIAKLLDVKVDRFSIGFGPPFAKLKIGETEYCFAPIPLGGYVKMAGAHPGDDVPPSEADRAITAKPLWVRYLVYFAGPAANLLLPIAVYFFHFVANETVVTPAVVGSVVDGSAAAAAELEQGDRIVSIDNRDVRSWAEMQERIEGAAGEEIELQIERDGKRLDRVVTPSKTITRNQLGVKEVKGRLGVQPVFYAPQIGVIDRSSPAYDKGLRTGDVITSINGEPVETIEELERMLAASGAGLLRLTYLRPVAVQNSISTFLWYDSHHAQLLPEKGGATGILPAQTFVRALDPGSPADLAGVKPGDRIVSADGAPMSNWVTLNDVFGRKRDEAIAFVVESPGSEPRTVEIALAIRTWKNIYQHTEKQPWFGAYPYDKSFLLEREPIRGRFTYALWAAVDQTGESIKMLGTALRQMLALERSMDELSSVVGIYQLAGTAYDQGPSHFLFVIALLSINLGIINLLPIPVLDGGHLMFFTIEAVRRKPLGQRAREIAFAIGFIIIILLLLIATRNDIVRWISADDPPAASPSEP